jgi:RimJ/RimL family protein N-acetyltransferase
VGIDQFIGEEDYVNKGVGQETIKMFVELITQKCRPRSIILDPAPDNKRAVRCYEKLGFKHYETVETENGHSAYLMRLEIYQQPL